MLICTYLILFFKCCKYTSNCRLTVIYQAENAFCFPVPFYLIKKIVLIFPLSYSIQFYKNPPHNNAYIIITTTCKIEHSPSLKFIGGY